MQVARSSASYQSLVCEPADVVPACLLKSFLQQLPIQGSSGAHGPLEGDLAESDGILYEESESCYVRSR